MWQEGTMSALPTISGLPAGIASSLDETGQDVVGVVHTFETSMRGVIWRGGTATDIGSVDSLSRSQPMKINRFGQVVGYSFDNAGSVYRPFLLEDGTMYDLNSLIPKHDRSDWNLMVANGLNDHGEIVGYGLYRGLLTGFKLSPQKKPR